MLTAEDIIKQTKKWVADVVIGCNFCPFANAVIKQEKVFYRIVTSNDAEQCLMAVLEECKRLDNDSIYETTLLILPYGFDVFSQYLDLVSIAEQMLKQKKYEGIYQLASFHPNYIFSGSQEDDAANYTNRSPYPMLHILKEASIEMALENYKNPEDIPNKNVAFARTQGLAKMQALRKACMNVP
ncbi:MAG: hypothetical protein RL115_967 [Bacteroidota bacterium]|jgi:hypothetical protein